MVKIFFLNILNFYLEAFNFKVHIQTLIPDVEPIESRKPIRQTMIEMASYLKKELSQKTGYL